MIETIGACVYVFFFIIAFIFVAVLLVKVCAALIDIPRQIERLPDKIARNLFELQREEERRKQAEQKNDQ